MRDLTITIVFYVELESRVCVVSCKVKRYPQFRGYLRLHKDTSTCIGLSKPILNHYIKGTSFFSYKFFLEESV